MADTLIVFDLDDTIYPERDYVRSSLRHVANFVGKPEIGGELVQAFESGLSDPIEAVLAKHCLVDRKEEAVASMRHHMPDIEMYNDAADCIARLRRENFPLVIVTDGRSVTQRAKIEALGLTDANYLSISNEIGLAKTDPARFEDIEARYHFPAYAYVGDNPSKDFLAPRKLGWATVMRETARIGIHSQDMPADPAYRPDTIVQDFWDLMDVVADVLAHRDVR